jgi:hypothetical protein
MGFEEIVHLVRGELITFVAVVITVYPAIRYILRDRFKDRIKEREAENKRLKKKLDNIETEKVGSGKGVNEEVSEWNYKYPTESPIVSLFPETNDASQRDLEERIEESEEKITIFGLTRNFFASERMRKILIRKAQDVPITLFIMDPDCESRRHRYRVEPTEAALENSERFRREVEKPLQQLLSSVNSSPAGSSIPGVSIYYYNFTCSFAIEEIDSACRVLLYGHGERGTEGPIIVFREGNPYFEYFSSQLRWMEKLATNHSMPEWGEKGISLRQLKPE